jgi:signal transduction histidine kinase
MAGAPVEPHGHLVIPLTARGQVMGCVCLLTWPGYVFDPARVELLEAISHQLSVAVANACLYEQIQHMAVLEERERISREMHDGLAQVLGYLNLKSQAAQAALRSGQVKHAAMAVREIEHVAQAAYAEIREAILGLRTVVSPGTDLFVSLTEYVHHFKREWGIDVRLIVPAGVTLTFAPNAEVQLLRIIQEALANVRKHAQAKQAWVRFEVDGDAAVVTIEDDGIGFDPVRVGPGRFGLAMMGERAESVGGTFELETAPGAGTRVIVRLPLNPILVE